MRAATDAAAAAAAGVVPRPARSALDLDEIADEIADLDEQVSEP